MVIKREVAYGILRSLSDFWKCEELQDFSVTVGSTTFGCHRFLLAACSGFFRRLFRSGMIETVLKCATVKFISKETFESILETLYTGHNVLTNDNVIDIWRAAHQLHIPFLIKECEEFAISTLSLDNYIEYYKIANLFESKEVIKFVWSFILKNANSFFQTNFFYEMQVSDVLKLIQSQDLETTSEDDVVHAVLKWVEFRPCETDSSSENSDNEAMSTFSNQKNNREGKDRKHQFPVLLSNTRICLVNKNCLGMLIEHPLVRETKAATDIVIKALLYQLQVGQRNGQWPPGAIYRNNGNYVNVAVAIYKQQNKFSHESTIKIKAFSFLSKKWFQLPDLLSKSNVTFFASDKSLYAFGKSVSSADQFFSRTNLHNKQFIQLTNRIWSEIIVSFHFRIEPHVVVVDAILYIISPSRKEIWQLDLATGASTRKADFPFNVQSICHVTNYEHFILVFYLSGKTNKTDVCSFDTSQNTWKTLGDFDGLAAGMISFKHRHSVYLLQTNGNLWMVESQSKDVTFKQLAKLWICDWTLHGAVTFIDDLYIYGVMSKVLEYDFKKKSSLEGLFSQIIYMNSEDSHSSTFIPVTLSRQCLI
uniref:BTB domain-containing protein n=1 Tax=Biomphalaria glabrata TaxID=6526 RepID=A0A2C9KUF7_BIOGL